MGRVLVQRCRGTLVVGLALVLAAGCASPAETDLQSRPQPAATVDQQASERAATEGPDGPASGGGELAALNGLACNVATLDEMQEMLDATGRDVVVEAAQLVRAATADDPIAYCEFGPADDRVGALVKISAGDAAVASAKYSCDNPVSGRPELRLDTLASGDYSCFGLGEAHMAVGRYRVTLTPAGAPEANGSEASPETRAAVSEILDKIARRLSSS